MKKYVVNKVENEGQESWSMSGPFIVRARNPSHAARLVRHTWPQYLSNHVRVETNALAVRECKNPHGPAFISDRRGLVVPSAARFN